MDYSDQKRPRVGNYAFWPYDCYPYLLGSKITRVHKRRFPEAGEPIWAVETEGYGVGCKFACFIELPPKAATAALEQLDELKRKLHTQLSAVRADSNRELRELLERDGRTTQIFDRIIPAHAKPKEQA